MKRTKKVISIAVLISLVLSSCGRVGKEFWAKHGLQRWTTFSLFGITIGTLELLFAKGIALLQKNVAAVRNALAATANVNAAVDNVNMAIGAAVVVPAAATGPVIAAMGTANGAANVANAAGAALVGAANNVATAAANYAAGTANMAADNVINSFVAVGGGGPAPASALNNLAASLNATLARDAAVLRVAEPEY